MIMDLKNKVNRYPMKELAPIICEFLEKGKNVIITARGNSMRPMLRNRRDHLTLSPCEPENLAVSDVVFYIRENGVFVVHRIVDTYEDGYLVMGDFQLSKEKVPYHRILGKVTAFRRGKKDYSVDDNGYIRYVNLWNKSRFWRRAYISLSYRLGRIKTEL